MGKRPFSRPLHFDGNAPAFRSFEATKLVPESCHCHGRPVIARAPDIEALEDAGMLGRELPGNSEPKREIIAADDDRS